MPQYHGAIEQHSSLRFFEKPIPEPCHRRVVTRRLNQMLINSGHAKRGASQPHLCKRVTDGEVANPAVWHLHLLPTQQPLVDQWAQSLLLRHALMPH